MTSQTITIPAREVRPGDVLFGMTVKAVPREPDRQGLSLVYVGELPVWLDPDREVTVERPVPSDPIGTVRAKFHEAVVYPLAVYRKTTEDVWLEDGDRREFSDAEVADFPILWKPGMPIPTEGGQA